MPSAWNGRASAGRSTSASTNALSPAAATRAAKAFGSMSSRLASTCAAAACSGFAIVVLSIPNRSTGRSVTSRLPFAPRMSARSANAWSTCSRPPVARSGCTSVGASRTRHSSSEPWLSRAVVR